MKLICPPLKIVTLVVWIALGGHSFSSAAQGLCVLPTSENSQGINISFVYKEGPSLRGPPADAVVFQRLNGSTHIPSLALSDDGYTNKQHMLSIIRTSLMNKHYVYLNFSGHGVLVPELDEAGKWDGKSREWAMMLPSSHLSFPSLDYLHNNISRVEAELRQAISSPIDAEKLAWLKKEKLRLQESLRSLIVHEESTAQEWLQHVITQRELADVLKGKNVYGMIDACHSGALSKLPSKMPGSEVNLLLACGADQTASDYFKPNLNSRDLKRWPTLDASLSKFNESLREVKDIKGTLYLRARVCDWSEASASKETLDFLRTKHPHLLHSAELLGKEYYQMTIEKLNPTFHGGALVHYYNSFSGAELDTNKDGLVSFSELKAKLPRTVFSSLSHSQRPQATSGCTHFSDVVGYSATGFLNEEGAVRPHFER